MKQNIEEAINTQIKEELFSSYIYIAMAAYCEHLNLRGMANWFSVQGQEEVDHARGLYNYLIDAGGRVKLQAIPEPPADFKGPLGMAEETLKHEQYITGKIHALYELATQEKDYASQSFLKWYIDEQVEEEASATELIEKIKMVGKDQAALYMLDKEMFARKYIPSSILSLEK